MYAGLHGIPSGTGRSRADLADSPAVREAAREVGRIVRDAARLLLRHWPALLTLGLLGAAWRSGTLWLAVIVSDRSGPLAQLLLALAPVGYLLAIVAMLRVVRPSLSAAMLVPFQVAGCGKTTTACRVKPGLT